MFAMTSIRLAAETTNRSLLRFTLVRGCTAFGHTRRCFASWGTPTNKSSVRSSLVVGLRQRREATSALAATAAEPVAVGDEENRYASDLVVVLDMDECLIHSKWLSPQDARYVHQASSWKKRQRNQPPVEFFRLTLPDGDVLHVHKRPYLQEFLEHVGRTYETHIFTAAAEEYAKPVLDYLDPEGTIFAKRWYRDSCTPIEIPSSSSSNGDANSNDYLFPSPTQQGYTKNLGVLGKDAARMVLVDNNPYSFLVNPENGILVPHFYEDSADTTLLNVLTLLEELEQERDVRPALHNRLHLKDSIQELQQALL